MGDIHGGFSRLEAALALVRFDPDRDRLFAVGNLVDRGPESVEVLNWLVRPWFYALCSNHELMSWRRAVGDPMPVIGPRVHGGGWLDECDAVTRAAVAEAWRALPLAIEMETPTGKVGLIHADFPCDDWQAIHGRDFSEGDEEACLWSMDRHRRRCEQPIRLVRAVVQGHLTLPSPWQLGRGHYIDTGGWRVDGQFTLLDLHALKPCRSLASRRPWSSGLDDRTGVRRAASAGRR